MKTMKKKLLFTTLLLIVFGSLGAQTYMNEWIDFNKTYFRFKVGATGIYRITQAELSAMGIGSADAAHLQLWRHGQQIPIYTSSATGALPSNGFMEFWGESSDGEWEKRLYLDPQSQINPTRSLFTDTVAYFLTVNPSGGNRRLEETNNDISSPLPTEPYFIHKAKVGFRNIYNPGFAAVVGDYVYSSSYEAGEGFTSSEFRPANPLVNTISNLFVAPGGPDASFYYTAVGRALNTRSVKAFINGTQVSEREMNYFNYVKDNSATNIPLSLLSSNTASIQFKDSSAEPTDRIVIGMYQLTYPRQFNFGAQNNFEFEMPASVTGNNLVITNFNAGSSAPVLYDLTNGLRITAQVLGGNQFRVVLPASATNRRLILTSQDAGIIKNITGLSTRTFINYGNTSNQGDYLIISNPLIYFDQNGVNQVEQYRLYRNTANGGGFNTKIYDINQIIDQFGWGIKNNALSIRNFLRYARNNFAQYPKYTLLIGKGIAPHTNRAVEFWSNNSRMNLIPVWGVPTSDMTLASDEGTVVPKIPIGRLNVVYAKEVGDYLDKLKQYETSQRNFSCTISDELWKKSVIHIGGANDYLGEQILYYLNRYRTTIQDTLFGATVTTLQRSSLTSVQSLAGAAVDKLFNDGFSLLTYFGHSSPNTLEFNLDNPGNYPVTGKFPIFLVNGCNAGNLFLADSQRFNGSFTLSEKYLFSAPGKGAIAFIASTHLGIVNYLNLYSEEFYNQMNKISYGKSIGKIMMNVSDTLIRRYSINDFYVRMHVEEITLHGDPAVSFYNRPKPDLAIEQSYVKVSPEFISIAEDDFNVTIKMVNIGRAINDSVRVEVQREFPNGSRQVVFNSKIPGIRFGDSLNLTLPINSQTDKGVNKIIVSIDTENAVDEMCETNNTVTKEFFIFEDEIRATYPYNYGIVNKQNISYFASTANPFGRLRNYYFEIDTTRKFNSSIKKIDSVTSVGGSIEFKPNGITFNNNSVYYWRVGMKPDAITPVIWNNSSFIYRSTLDTGFNQSHYYQYSDNKFTDMLIDSSSRNFEYKKVIRKLIIKTGLYPYFDVASNVFYLDLQQVDKWRCNFNVFSIYVFEPKTLKSKENRTIGGNGLGGSLPVCQSIVRKFFEFPMENREYRNRARLFLEDSIPNGSLVMIVNQGTGVGGGFVGPNTAFIKHWMDDTLVYGTDKSIYHTFIKNGLTDINKFNKNLPFTFVYEKGNPNFVRQFIGEKESDFIDVVMDVPAQLFEGAVESPWVGPAKNWKNFTWDGYFPGGKTASDSLYFEIYGKTNNSVEFKLATVTNAKDTSLSFINAQTFPYLKMRMYNSDPITLSPFQLEYWRLSGSSYPEGAMAPNIKFSFKDTLEFGEPQKFAIAFRNVSETAFDSLKLKMIITDRNNVPKEIILPKKKPLIVGDSLVVSYTFDTKDLLGNNTLYLMVNPDNDQPEQFLFNNFIYRDFFVKSDNYNPWMDVTFDGTHILNGDIVSAKPHILIKLKDDSRYMALNDTTGLKIKIRYPGGSEKEFKLGSDTARFTPANLNNGDNTATVDLYPFLKDDGSYELFVSGTDRSGNKAGELEYSVAFEVLNKPMISNLLNYPNPFTTSTAFVFTLTGSVIPQNMRIQILTVTGKVVREITKEELGPIRIGRNITEFKWDGTDQFGNKLGNGIYLYRVLTNLNGQALDQYKSKGDRTDQFFNKGYGKMYLMR